MLKIPNLIFEQMIEHAKKEYPLECCGLLAGKGNDVSKLYTLTNKDASAVSYLIEPQEQFAAFKDARADGIDILSVFHSHPHTDAFPSETDKRLAYYPEMIYIIISLKDKSLPVLRGFKIIEGNVSEEKISIF